MFPESELHETASIPSAPPETDNPVTHLTPHEARALVANEVAKVVRAVEALGVALAGRESGDFEETLYFPASTAGPETPLSYQGKQHFIIWVPASTTGVSLNVPGIGVQSGITLAAGWTVLDPPRGARLIATTAFTARIRYTDRVPAGLY